MTLVEYITSKMDVPFEYGKNDCILFTIGWAELASGEKYLPEPLWTNEKEALKAIKKYKGIENNFNKYFDKIEANFAQDGDLTIVNGIAYLFSGSKIVSVSDNGLVFKNRTNAINAWRIKWQT